MTASAPRTDQPLWELIREAAATGGSVTIQCPPHLRSRIRKAVKKEKCMDAAYNARYHSVMHVEFLPTGLRFSVDQSASRSLQDSEM